MTHAPSGSPSPRPPADSVSAPRGPSRVVSGPFQIQSLTAASLLCLATLILMTLTLPPAGAWPLSYVCLAPWMVCACCMARSPWMYGVSYLLGVVFFAINTYWLFDVTPPGYIALCVHFGLSFPLAAWPVRHFYRRHGAPVTITLPIVWTAVEFLRGQTLIGFPWFYLSHGHHRVLPMIQISDLTGVYGLSFVIAMMNGWITDLLIQPFLVRADDRPARATRLPVGTLLAPLVLAAVYLYGSYRMAETARTMSPGPRVAIVQQDLPLKVESNGVNDVSPELGMEGYFVLARQAAAQHPDIIVMPEGAWPLHLNSEFVDAGPEDLEAIRSRAYPAKFFPGATPAAMKSMQMRCARMRDAVRQLVTESGATLVVGANTIEWRPDRIPERVDRYNSAYVFTPESRPYLGRYDKIHLVLFGEFVPFRFTSLHGLYEWLNARTPWGAAGLEYSLSFGEEARRFQCPAPSLGGKTFRFATPICYEDTVSSVIAEFVGRGRSEKQVDFLINVSNDGWFNHSSELEQHLAASVFRAVEFRVPIARSVNTGVSIFIRPTGAVHDRVRISRKQEAEFRRAEEVFNQLHAIARGAADKLNGKDAAPDASDPQAAGAARTLLMESLPAALSRLSLAYQEELAEQQPGNGRPRPAASAAASAATSSAATSSAAVAHGPANASTQKRRPGEFDHEYDLLRVRLRGLFAQIPNRRGPLLAGAWSRFADQLAADLDTLTDWRRQTYTAPGYRVAELQCDSRHTVYAQWGDWFAWICVALSTAFLGDWTLYRLRRPSRKQRRAAARAAAEAVAAATAKKDRTEPTA